MSEKSNICKCAPSGKTQQDAACTKCSGLANNFLTAIFKTVREFSNRIDKLEEDFKTTDGCGACMNSMIDEIIAEHLMKEMVQSSSVVAEVCLAYCVNMLKSHGVGIGPKTMQAMMFLKSRQTRCN